MYNTGNPVPSTDVKDLRDNAQVFDEGMNGGAETFLDRLGRPRNSYQAFHNLVINAKNQIDPTIAAAKLAVNQAAETAEAEMLQTAAELGDDLNNKYYSGLTAYADMVANPQVRDAVVAVVDGDANKQLDGSYVWDMPTATWVRWSNQPVLASDFSPVLDDYELVGQFERNYSESDPIPGYVEVDEDLRMLMKVDELGHRTYYPPVTHEGLLAADHQSLGGQALNYLSSVEYELSGYLDVTVDEDLRVLSQPIDLSSYVTGHDVQRLIKEIPPRKGQLRFAVLGDSRTANAWAAGGKLTQPRSYPFWVELFSRGAARFVGAWNYGIAGQNTDQILPRAATAAATDADAVVILCGVNDALGAASLANIQLMVNTIVAAGKYAVVVAELPRGDTGASAWAAPRILQHWRLHQGLLAMAAQPGVRAIDAMSTVLDPASPIGDFLPGYSYDNLHLRCIAALTVGRSIASAVADVCRTQAPLLLTNVDAFSSTDNRTGNLVANGMMAGTGGTLQGVATGVVADSWQVSSTSGMSATASKVARPDGTSFQQVTFSGAAEDAAQIVQLKVDIPASNIAVGDIVEFIAEIEVDAGSVEMYGPDMQLIVNGASDILSVGYNRAESATSPMPSVAYGGVYRSQPHAFTATPTSLQLSIQCQGKQGALSSGTFRVARASLKKV